MSRNPNTCPHNITEVDDDGDPYCAECGIDLRESRADYLASVQEDRFQQEEL